MIEPPPDASASPPDQGGTGRYDSTPFSPSSLEIALGMHEPSVAGRSIVTRRAIVDIVRTAVQSSYGVTGFADPSFALRLARWFHLAEPGIRLSMHAGINLDLYLTVAYGVPVAEVARQVDSAVRYGLRRTLGSEIACLAIHVDGLHYQPTAPLPNAEPEAEAASEPADGDSARSASGPADGDDTR